MYRKNSPWTLSIIIAFLMGLVSSASLIFSTNIYVSDELFQTFVVNDALNLIIGVPILLVSKWLFHRGELIGLLIWPGALLYVLYNYIAYIFGIPFCLITVAYLAIVIFSSFGIFDLLKNMDHTAIKQQLADVVPVKTAGWILVLFGCAFFFRAIGEFAAASASQMSLASSDIGVLIADLVISPAWIIGGALLLRRKPLGYVSGLGLLFFASMLFIGLILFLLLNPILTDAPFVLTDVIVILIMGMVFFIPTWLYARGVLLKSSR
jgi:hypothetical protein